ncbi:dTDP-4-dehydrorhamnose reductase [Entomospira culicis]|uniref:dTDP-4-dehydrorhamnose reductase n=1 Tax=Entomospira culicis TaxID=2719989 RepID=A0A968GJW7_9SPIO|nr:dTDP-4-dehydrorhamnose reductase [Entomospira culicis]NIZ19836.1 dTDP-4-dehydrorhamnose reductase [Entomospira culicis]NIZ70050.1 dTDP-4-dehydrorhamnose reductase [Entomospira culicis]WDI37156.1 dTDP-4-dehydrorhamnose reductase [Entomospira culicis]WDI38785.1 dTDP-4-dehydrorhamnose reductase [Entomospira culicis]
MRIWITGGDGQLARALQQQLRRQGAPFVATNRSQCDLTDYRAVESFAQQYRPTLIMHTAAFTHVDHAQQHQLQALADNLLATRNLTHIAQPYRAKIVFFSTDYLFDGTKTSPYLESDCPNPLQWYGKSKLLAEETLHPYPNHLIIRLSWLYSTERGFVLAILQQLRTQASLTVVENEIGTPTFIPSIVPAILALATSPAVGTYHLASEGEVSRYHLAQATLNLAQRSLNLSTNPTLHAITSHAYRQAHPQTATRPIYSPLASQKAKQTLAIASLGTWQEHLQAFFRHYLL